MMPTKIRKKGICIVTVCNKDLANLKKTIKSIDKQIVQPDLHLVITKNINLYSLQPYKRKNRKFVINKDKSLYNAMNIGLKNNFFSHILFLNSEDILFNNFIIYNLKNYLLRNKTIVAKTILQNKFDKFLPKKNVYRQHKYLPHSSFVAYINRSTEKIYFNEHYPIMSDGIWMKKILFKTKRIFLNKNLTIHTLGGVSTNPSISSILKYSTFNDIYKQILKAFLGFILSSKRYYRVIYFFKYKILPKCF